MDKIFATKEIENRQYSIQIAKLSEHELTFDRQSTVWRDSIRVC